MIAGETVTVRFRTFGEVDEYGNESEGYSDPVTFENVLVGRGGTVDRIEDGHPYEIRADRRFCFPRGFSGDLRGALITRGDATYQVIGDPVPITDENIPGGIPWNIKAEAVRFDG